MTYVHIVGQRLGDISTIANLKLVHASSYIFESPAGALEFVQGYPGIKKIIIYKIQSRFSTYLWIFPSTARAVRQRKTKAISLFMMLFVGKQQNETSLIPVAGRLKSLSYLFDKSEHQILALECFNAKPANNYNLRF